MPPWYLNPLAVAKSGIASSASPVARSSISNCVKLFPEYIHRDDRRADWTAGSSNAISTQQATTIPLIPAIVEPRHFLLRSARVTLADISSCAALSFSRCSIFSRNASHAGGKGSALRAADSAAAMD
jgi:hypothetical protein